MLYYSTNDSAHRVDLKEAILRSLPPDNGLYLPERLPENVLSPELLAELEDADFSEVCALLAGFFFSEDVPADILREIATGAVNFPAPLISLSPGDHVLELFHGPTLAFKDFGARFMARLMAWLVRGEDRELTVLAATSGDTGGAVASAFHNVPGVRVVVLYPRGKVSPLQEKQFTALGGNISALEVDGSFDDCQRMVKAAFLDRDLVQRRNLTSANSINFARLVPQTFYYVEALRQLPPGIVPTFVVPSGNFGNLTAGLLAARMGLPVNRFVAATNANDVVPAYLKSGDYQPRPSIATLSNAMDVGAPSNFARMQAIFGGSWQAMRGRIDGIRVSDDATRAAIREVKSLYQYEIDPHGAVAWLAARKWRSDHPAQATVALATAHPAKFLEAMERELGAGAVEIPERLAVLAQREKSAVAMPADEAALKEFLG